MSQNHAILLPLLVSKDYAHVSLVAMVMVELSGILSDT